MNGLARGLALHVDQLVAADLAQPGEQRRFAPEAVQVANRLDERGLHQILDGRGGKSGATRSERPEAPRIRGEKCIERPRIASEHACDELPIVLVHLRVALLVNPAQIQTLGVPPINR